MLYRSFILLCTLVFITSCGSGGSNSSSGESDIQTGLPNNLNGLITLDEFLSPDGVFNGIASFRINAGKVSKGIKVTSGFSPYRHLDGTLTFKKTCSQEKMYDTQISILVGDFITPITPCITALTSFKSAHYEVSKLSPDKSMIAIEISHREYGYGKYLYTTIVVDLNGVERARFDDFRSPDWFKDGRLLLLGDTIDTNYGFFISNTDLNSLTKISNRPLNSPSYSADLSPSNKQIIFENNHQIWTMDVDGEKLSRLISSSSHLKFPTWSPNEQYIAYLVAGDGNSRTSYLKKIMFFNVASKKSYEVETDNIFTRDTYNHVLPFGPLSWIE